MTPRQNGTPALGFQPDHFFLSRTEGRGLIRDRTGRRIDGCAIVTDGAWDHGLGGLRLNETFTFDGGLVDVLNWTFAPDAQGRMSASESSLAQSVQGWSSGLDYHLRFRRKGAPGLERLTLTYDVRFTLMEPDLALKVARLKLFGVTLGEMIAFHRRLD